MPILPTAARRLVLGALLAFTAGRAAAADYEFADDGLHVGIKGMGGFSLSYPRLEPGDRDPVERKLDGGRAELTYAGNIHISLAIADGGKYELRFRDVPPDIKSFRVETKIGAEYIDGGTWTIGGNEAKPFPKEKPEKPHLFQGNAGKFMVRDASGHTFSLTIPDFCYMQLTDNREWGWKIFNLMFDEPYNSGWQVHTIALADGIVGGAATKLIDRFGQPIAKSYPGKIKDEAELKADVAGEEAYYASLKPMATDAWGGLPDSAGKLGLQKTGFFHVEKKGERWLMVDPDGNAYFHLGLCGFGFLGDHTTYVKDREDIFEWLPPTDGDFAKAWHHESWWHDKAFSFYLANVGRKYGLPIDSDRYMARMVDRVRRIGFNAAGAFSGNHPAFTAAKFPRVEMTGMGPGLPGINGVPDPYDADTLARFDHDCSGWVKDAAEDPAIIGWFFANEQAFEDVPRGVPQLPGKHAAKRKLVEQLQKTYPTIADFDAAWGVKLADWTAVADTGLPVTTDKAFADMKTYTEGFLEAYYAALETTMRKYDRRHLLIGSRWQPGTANSEALCRAAGRHMDVISINYYTLGVDAGFMQRLHQWTGDKPQIWSEFYYTSGDESPCAGGGQDMKSQKARGEAYRTYIERGASLGFVVGIEWFLLNDQAVTGRWFQKLNGERANTGLFDVLDRPYRDAIGEMSIANREVYDVWLAGKKPYQIDDARFGSGANARKSLSAGKATGPIAIDGSTTNWPGRPPERIGSDRLVNGKTGAGLEASFKACWDDANLYVLVTVTDPTPLNNTRSGGDQWNGDGVELFVGHEHPETEGPLLASDRQLLLAARAGAEPRPWFLVNAATQPEVRMTAKRSVDGTGYTLEAAVPWKALGVTAKDGATLLFDLGIDDAPAGGERERQLMWSGGPRNSSDRSGWGRLQLVP